MNILITGGCGFIGSNFIKYYLNKYNNVQIINIDCINYCSNTTYITERNNYKFIKGNITDIHLVNHILNEYNIDIIIHFAAQSHVDNSFDKPLQYTIDNIYGTHVLLQCAKEYGKIKKFIHFSTDEVYGEVPLIHEGCKEDSILNPTNPYAATKAGAELLVQTYYHSFKLPIIIIRCNNVYGEYQYPEKLIPKFIKLLYNNKKLTIHGKGDTRRNFIWVKDVCSAVDIILEKGTISEIYNIGTSQEYSVLNFAKLLISKIHNTNEYKNYIEYIEDRPFNDYRYAINSDKLRLLGWKEIHNDFDKNIEKLIAFYYN